MVLTRSWAALMLAASLLGSAPAQAQMGEKLGDEFHKESELGTRMVLDKDLPGLGDLLRDPSVKIICAEVSLEKFKLTDAQHLIEWVRSGHSLWIYDARICPYFGFLPFYMEKQQFTNKPEKGTINGKKTEGVATPALALKESEWVTGVESVTAFLPVLPDGKYGAVNVTADTQPLLQFTLGSPAVAAYRREGRGVIIFKPLVWTEPMSGDRFQRNLLEYSAGFQIPGPAGSGKVGNPPGPKADFVTGNPATPLPLSNLEPSDVATPIAATNSSKPPDPKTLPQTTSIECKDGNFKCRVDDELLKFETGTASLKIPCKDIKSVIIGDVTGLDLLETWNGEVKKGFLMTSELQIEHGKEHLVVKKRDLQRLEFEKGI